MENKHTTLKLLSIFLLSCVLLSGCKKEEPPEEEVSHVLTERERSQQLAERGNVSELLTIITEQRDPTRMHSISEQVRGQLKIELFPDDTSLSEEELNEESARLSSIWMSWANRLQTSVVEREDIFWNADGIPIFSINDPEEDFNRFITAMRETQQREQLEEQTCIVPTGHLPVAREVSQIIESDPNLTATTALENCKPTPDLLGQNDGMDRLIEGVCRYAVEFTYTIGAMNHDQAETSESPNPMVDQLLGRRLSFLITPTHISDYCSDTEDPNAREMPDELVDLIVALLVSRNTTTPWENLYPNELFNYADWLVAFINATDINATDETYQERLLVNLQRIRDWGAIFLLSAQPLDNRAELNAPIIYERSANNSLVTGRIVVDLAFGRADFASLQQDGSWEWSGISPAGVGKSDPSDETYVYTPRSLSKITGMYPFPMALDGEYGSYTTTPCPGVRCGVGMLKAPIYQGNFFPIGVGYSMPRSIYLHDFGNRSSQRRNSHGCVRMPHNILADIMETGFTEGTEHRALIDIVNADLAVGPYAATPTTGRGHLSGTNDAFGTWLSSAGRQQSALQGVNVGDDPDWDNHRFPSGRNAYAEEMTIGFSGRNDRETAMMVLVAYISLTDSPERGPTDPADPNDSTPSQLFMPGTAHNSDTDHNSGTGRYGYDGPTWERMVYDRTNSASANANVQLDERSFEEQREIASQDIMKILNSENEENQAQDVSTAYENFLNLMGQDQELYTTFEIPDRPENSPSILDIMDAGVTGSNIRHTNHIFKRENTSGQPYQARIASYRLCQLIQCSFVIPRTVPGRLRYAGHRMMNSGTNEWNYDMDDYTTDRSNRTAPHHICRDENREELDLCRNEGVFLENAYQWGAYQDFLTNFSDLECSEIDNDFSPEEIIGLHIFDFLTANTDRQGDNCASTGERLASVDNGSTFGRRIRFSGRDNELEYCNNGRDDNNNGLIDCREASCRSDPRCADYGNNGNYESCDNDIDDDGDGLSDCEDLGCSRSIEASDYCNLQRVQNDLFEINSEGAREYKENLPYEMIAFLHLMARTEQCSMSYIFGDNGTGVSLDHNFYWEESFRGRLLRLIPLLPPLFDLKIAEEEG